MKLLDVEDMHLSYGLSRVLFGVSMHVNKGELVSLVGRNGVGKSSTIRGIIGATPVSSGTIAWKGEDISRRPMFQNVRAGIGFVPEDRRIFPDLSVWENLDVARRPAPDGTGWDEARVFELFPDLARFSDRKGGLLSGGQQQMLTIGRSLMGNPELLLLDEPSEGLAPLVVRDLRDKIRQLRDAGLSIVLAEQNLGFVLSLSDRLYVLEKGRVVYSGTPEEMQAHPEIRDQYLAV